MTQHSLQVGKDGLPPIEITVEQDAYDYGDYGWESFYPIRRMVSSERVYINGELTPLTTKEVHVMLVEWGYVGGEIVQDGSGFAVRIQEGGA